MKPWRICRDNEDMKILGISCHYHESAAALIVDGRIVAASAEERFSRNKHDAGFPSGAIAFCLAQANIEAKDLDFVVFYEKPFFKFERNLSLAIEHFPHALGYFVDSMRNALTQKLWIKSEIAAKLDVDGDKVLFVPQHLSHAAASFYPSPFEKAAVLTLDGVGEWTTGTMGTATGNQIHVEKEMRFPHSVGLLYSAFTAYLGFEVNDGEYKVMGMAAYGKPRHVKKIRKLFRQSDDGSFVLDLTYFSFQYSNTRMYTQKFIELFDDCDRFDLSASLQEVVEDVILSIVRALYKRTQCTDLVYGGGVALNSVINAAILAKTPFKRLFIFPAAGDDGGAVGAALYVYHHVLGHKKRYPLKEMFLGAAYTNRQIEDFLRSHDIKFRKLSDAALLTEVTDALVGGKVIGWFEGREEFGPRALGHRSILADPKKPKMKDIVNSKIKFREEFRPFAPVILEEKVLTYFPDADKLMSPFMLATFHASTKAKYIAAATVHVDGSSRIQTVNRDYRGRYRKVLELFYKTTGRPILLNTSFNLKGEPIVNTPQNAYGTFMRSGIDMLVLENYIVEK